MATTTARRPRCDTPLSHDARRCVVDRMTTQPTTHVYFLLDRTGSMASMAADVIGGFNGFVESQRRQPGEARMTLVQFDTVDPFEIVTDALTFDRVRPLTARTFVP